MDRVTIQQILPAGDAAFERGNPLSAQVRRAAWALLVCRTAVVGGPVQRCPDGHVERVWYHCCQHRRCSPCAGLQGERWLTRQRARLLACAHAHLRLTRPDEWRGCWLAHVRVMTALLCTTVRETLVALLADERHLGAEPGRSAALHTWSHTLVRHPHLHG